MRLAQGILVLDQRIVEENHPFAARTTLGWLLLGPVQGTRNIAHMSSITAKDELADLTRQLYNHEFEDPAENEKQLSIDKMKAIEIIDKGTFELDKGYCVPLPWKANARIENNQGHARMKLNGL